MSLPSRVAPWREPRALLVLLALAGLPVVGAPVLGVWAGDGTEAAPTPEDEERAEQIERHTTKGLAAFRKGNHEEALVRMDRLEKLDPKSPLPRQVRARIFARTGRYDEALALTSDAVAADPTDRNATALRFDLLLRLGRHVDAEKEATAAVAARPDDLVARAALGRLLEERGRRKDALVQYDAILAAYNAKDPLPEEIGAVATAALRATRLSTNEADDLILPALKLLKKRLDADPDDVDLLVMMGDVYQANRGPNGQATASKRYREALEKNSELAEAHLGLARYFDVFWDKTKAAELARRALATNPNLVPAMSFLARIHVGDGDYDKADAMWERARKVNPFDKEARSVHAARVFIAGDKAGFEALEKGILADDPTYGSLYTTVADLVGERQRRFDVAAGLSKRAIEVDPTDDQSYVIQGVNLMNLGREDEALASFETARKASKGYKDVVRDNFTEVLEVLKAFVTVKNERFVLRQHVEESAVMEPYLLPVLEQAWADLSKKYEFVPQGPVLVESFHRHDDFSVRSVGAKNIPALGVCFGQVITLDGPFSRDVGEFSWARTAWHEFAHVITLQMSKGQVPRWLTEGLSVHEEKAHKAQWGREMDRELYDRWRNGRLLPMGEINHAFRGPDIMFAYFQGGLISDFITKDWGFDAIRKMLRRFGDDVPTEKVFEEVLKIPLADFDARFSTYVGTLVGDFKVVPRWDAQSKKGFEARVAKDPKDAEGWLRLAWCHVQAGRAIDAGAALDKARANGSRSPEILLLEGELAKGGGRKDVAKARFEAFLETGGDDMSARLFLAAHAKESGSSADAVKHYHAAKACFPRYVGKGNPYVELAKLYEGSGEGAKAIAEMEAYAEIAQEDFGVRRKLAAWYVEKKDDEALVRVSEEMIQITPFGANRKDKPDLDLHKRLAEAYVRLGRKAEAAREWRVQALLIDRLPIEERGAAGAVAARLAFGDLSLELGKADDAYEQAVAALAIDPTSAGAQALKARAIEAGALR